MEFERDVLVSPAQEVPVVEGEVILAIRALADYGVGSKAIARAVGVARNNVRHRTRWKMALTPLAPHHNDKLTIGSGRGPEQNARPKRNTMMRRNKLVLILACLFGALWAPVATTALQGVSDQILIDDPRPLAAAVLELEHRCHCVITYEDVKWSQAEVEDVPGLTKRTPNALRLQVPRGRPFAVTLNRQMSPTAGADMDTAFQAVLDAFERAGNAGAFRVVSAGLGFHVRPRDNALFDVRITLPPRTRSLAEALPDMLAIVGAATGSRILIGRVPVTLLMRTSTDDGASGERFGDVLTRALASTNKKISWRLLYDSAMKSYYLNLHGVD